MKALTDARIPVYFTPIRDEKPVSWSVLGNIPGETDDLSANLFFKNSSAYASTTLPVILISAAEVNFIKAEVYFRASDAANASLSFNAINRRFPSSLGLEAETADYLTNHWVIYNNTRERRIMEQNGVTMYQARCLRIICRLQKNGSGSNCIGKQ
jgi:hypothetical protein